MIFIEGEFLLPRILRRRNMINFVHDAFEKCLKPVELFYSVKKFASFHQVSSLALEQKFNHQRKHFSSIYDCENAIYEEWLHIYQISTHCTTVIVAQ